MEWVPGWRPGVVYSESGVAERDCIFTTLDGARESTWVVTEHDPATFHVEMLKVTPGYLVVRLSIDVRACEGGGSAAEVTYTYSALGPDGEAYVRSRTEEAYAEFMRGWEAALNEHLQAARAPS